jgi:hypothetical protein
MKQRFQILFSLLILFSGCSTPKSALDNTSNGNDQIPKAFNPSTDILLIEQAVDDDKSTVDVSTTNSVQTSTYMNAYMRKNRANMIEYADKNYHHKHEFATQDEIYNPNSKYSDKTTYQFALVTSLVKPNQYTKFKDNGQMESTHYQPIFKFYLYDRLNDKTYSALSNGSSLIMWAFKSAINKLNGVK